MRLKLGYGGGTLNVPDPIVPYENEVVHSREGIKSSK